MNKEPIIFFNFMGFRNFWKTQWEGTELTSIGKGPLNGPYKVWLMPCMIRVNWNQYITFNVFHKFIYVALCDLVSFAQIKNEKSSHRVLPFSACNFTKSNNPPCLLFTFLNLYKW